MKQPMLVGLPRLLTATLLAAACRDAISPERRAQTSTDASPMGSEAAATVRIAGVGSLGPGPAAPGGDRRDFDLDVASSLTGRVFFRDWSVVRADGTAGTLTVDSDPATKITAFRSTSTICADPTRGVEFDGIGRVNTGGDTNPAANEWLAFSVAACDNAGSGPDLLAISVPAHGYSAGPDVLSSGDLVKSDGGPPPPPPGNQSPTASFTYGCGGLTCTFTSTSSDPDGSIAGYSWTFGDGGTSTDQNPSHMYPAVGSYTVTLRVTDNQGATSDPASMTVTVTAPNQAPTVDAGPDQTAVTGLLYSFSWSFSDADNNGPWSYRIDWGDGSTTTGSKTSQGTFSAGHTYLILLPRSFTIRVTVTDAGNASGSDTKVVTVLLL